MRVVRDVAVVACCVAVVAACGGRTSLGLDSPGSRGAEGDAGAGGPTADASSEDVADAPPDVGPDASSDDAPDIGACQVVAPEGGACNALQPTGAPVPVDCASGPPPEPSGGGAIPDGNYVLVSSTFYGGCPFPGEEDRIAWSLCGTTWATVQETTFMGMMRVQNTDITPTVQGSSVKLSPTCPASMVPETIGFDVTPTGLTFYIAIYGGPVRVDQLARQ